MAENVCPVCDEELYDDNEVYYGECPNDGDEAHR